ncbi:MAG: flagellar basal body P-ring formation chaperone FlgA [Beijerinckiaceae bacterium]|nr:flagellar basal body P-ring formation chaperone FlgA [Beijerinckiaceae bacterium]
MKLLGSICLASLLALTPAAAVEIQLAVPQKTIYPGDLISASMLTARTFYINEGQGAGYVRAPETLEGKVAKRTLLANQPINVQAVEEQRLALVGRQIRVEYQEGALAISTVGSVLQAGALGESISVRILDGGRTVVGVVQRDGSVKVNGGS